MSKKAEVDPGNKKTNLGERFNFYSWEPPILSSQSEPGKKGSKGLKAILDWIYSLPLTAQQQAVLQVHAHHCDYWNGHNSRPGTSTIASRVRLKSTRRVDQIHRQLQADPGCIDCRFTGSIRDSFGQISRCPCYLLQRGPLIQEAPANGSIPSTYRLNLTLRAWAPVQLPITDRRLSTVPTTSTEREVRTFAGAKFSPTDSEIFAGGTPKISHPEPEIRRGAIRKTVLDRKNDCVNDLNTPAARELYSREDFQAWLSIKEALKSHLPADEWKLWVRPARLLWTMHGGWDLLIAVPPNAQILEHVVARKRLVHQIAVSFGRRVLWTKYPDDYEIERLKQEHRIDLTRKPSRSSESQPPSAAKGGIP